MFLSGCGINSDTNETPAIHPQAKENYSSLESFHDFYRRFASCLKKGDAAQFNPFIHPIYGLYIIEAAGALPSVVNIHDAALLVATSKAASGFESRDTVQRVSTLNKKSFFDFGGADITAMPKTEDLPQIDCDSPPEFYSKSGCFTQTVNPLMEVKIWNYTEMSEKEKERIEKVAKTVSETVINTAAFRAYFSLYNQKWYIVFMDFSPPCAA